MDAGSAEGAKSIKQGKTPSLRVAVNFYVPAEKVMKVYEMGAATFKALFKLREKYGLDRWFFEVERRGKSGDPKTMYSILPEQKLDEATRAELAGLKRYELAKIVHGDGNDETVGGEVVAHKEAQDGPIDGDVVAGMLPRLKALPRTMLNAFLGEFDVQRIKELKASQAAAALERLHALEAEARPAEVDPFQ